jgi:hypothetical protein
MHFLRQETGYCKVDKRRNCSMRRGLLAFTLTQNVKEYHQRCVEHVTKMTVDLIPVDYKPQDRRHLG